MFFSSFFPYFIFTLKSTKQANKQRDCIVFKKPFPTEAKPPADRL